MSEMIKIAINACHGGFNLSEAGYRRYAELKGLTLYPDKPGSIFCTYWTVPEDQRPQEPSDRRDQAAMIAFNKAYTRNRLYAGDMSRNDPVLIQVIEELGKKASGSCSNLVVEEIPRGTSYRITEYDGFESVETRDSVDWQVA